MFYIPSKISKSGLLDKISKASLYILVFLLPIWLLPITQDAISFQKQALLVLFVLIAFIAWLAKITSQGELNVKINLVGWAVILFIGTSLVSTITSFWIYGSFWGWSSNVSDSFIAILFFGILYFLISNIMGEKKRIVTFLLLLTSSVFLGALYAVLQLYKIFLIPLPFAKLSAFNTIGSLNVVSMLVAVILPIAIAMSFAQKGTVKWLFRFFSAFFLLILLILNFFNAWLILVIGIGIMVIFSISNLKNSENKNWFSLPMAILVISLFLLMFRVPIPGVPTSPTEVTPSHLSEIKIARGLFSDNPKILPFGSGPGTFSQVYSKYRDTNLNQTIFWGTRFRAGASEFLDVLLTKGLVGLLVFVMVLLSALIFGVKMVLNSYKLDYSAHITQVGLLASFVSVVAFKVLHYDNIVSSFIFWSLLGAMSVYFAYKNKSKEQSENHYLSTIYSFVFLIAVIFGVGLLFFGGQKYIAEVKYLRGINSASLGNLDNGISNVLSATSLNPSLDLYWRDLSQLYLSQLNVLLLKNDASDQQKSQQVQNIVSNMAFSSNQSILINPKNVENWNVRGFIYRNLLSVPGSSDLAIESYNKSSELEPSSPFSFTEIARVYLYQAQALKSSNDNVKKQELISKSVDNINKAIALKSDYAPAQYLLALVYEQQGESEQAILKLEETASVAQNDIGLAFQLGIIFYQRENFSKAQTYLERAKLINDNYSNARYILGLVYDKIGQKSKALLEFQKVQQLNPDNLEVIKIIDNLNANRPALYSIQSEPLSIEESPSEIK
ncbi:MAG: tetratricopeptide repeat protein [Candidatus Staskawiczbacteria bacterium]|nr:tetratricopeptide repeat protein [Candidatus Staskawiczbacteria bacterium]